VLIRVKFAHQLRRYEHPSVCTETPGSSVSPSSRAAISRAPLQTVALIGIVVDARGTMFSSTLRVLWRNNPARRAKQWTRFQQRRSLALLCEGCSAGESFVMRKIGGGDRPIESTGIQGGVVKHPRDHPSTLQNSPHRHVDPAAHLVRWRDSLGLTDVFRGHLAHAGEARQAHGAD
jgi:hypothetical protein